MKLYIVTVIVLTINVVENVKDSPDSSSTGDNPSDISSVSKFITDFHKQFEDESLSMARSDFSYSKSNVQEEASKGQKKPTLKGAPKGSHNEKNVTFHVKCKEDRQQGSLSVELVNSTRLSVILAPNPAVTSRHVSGDCVVVLFYSRSCPFSCLAAPHFNALPRAFPAIKIAAINAMLHQSYNTQFGIAGVPTLMLFHNGRPAAKFNDSEYTLEMFARFITRYTGIKNVERMYVTSADFGGPVPSTLAKETDWLLALAWAVVLGAVALGISRSKAWTDLVEAVASAWREAEHEHNY